MLAKFTSSGLAAELSAIAALLLVISLAFWVVIGRFRLHNALINIYISFAIMQAAMGEVADFGKYMPLVVFLTIIDSSLFEIHLSGSGLSIWQVVVLSFLEAGLLASIVFTFLPEKQILKYISIGSLDYFTSPLAIILWMVSPLLFLILISRRGK